MVFHCTGRNIHLASIQHFARYQIFSAPIGNSKQASIRDIHFLWNLAITNKQSEEQKLPKRKNFTKKKDKKIAVIN
ncbi:hypothetical protein HDF25_005083 [Pedobacter cryoconitis]|uniref:Uncharacterized protein n=1 Tax=Pedobacter cryoconitis TaxID=188932 RepID=A0A7X0J8F5_9SPHI|nr:hypothetical protein [Pedobacter cryoconitis]